MLGTKGSSHAVFFGDPYSSAITFETPETQPCTFEKRVSPLQRGQFALKRTMDIAGASIALVALAPVLLTVAALVKLDSRGPVLFSQVRWGMNGRKIRVYKFRSMRTDMCDATGVAQTVKNDPRITRIGAILRRTNIDELPQLINVLKGDMSLVGPRCHAIGMLAAGRLYEELVPHYHLRHRMRPGITGLAQMRGLRGPTDRSDKARARIVSDLYYVENFSVWLDVRIMVGTVISELRGGKGF
ncbi:UNVERIFIED_ORG: lipopolysaccharide/colanic/teichoic acid biosynthesis glycosyltransferase [Rhizobium sp. SORGH_AS260]|uniref:sugar transferase n=1 Tax=Agrobacterium TaxID=357 RepID=UPI001FCC0A72|nr:MULTISPECIES: sugar transferase [Agrobacterium]MDP9731843.1 lipopolysaccharide/colanic/teichoic acid biosynthesis glycosyltransferase [Rhizobium sp. SORGH_AS_0285]MDP9756321.1 lipopolysaccharide/colanic/teichoic acid biosynthesis glycosyltransferase [Rhizobium sp. SORGH_AS_0260]MDR6081017.1 lipopolysaccharide/colanic/teichoic acid biosynthesis glycosyltransferase [Agrobacterium sp. SORGH_AS_0440]MDR6188108.1 lipopolysaccharide/colanic/teichoic acid biosynthesis glycosyltransferase [Agrobacte